MPFIPVAASCGVLRFKIKPIGWEINPDIDHPFVHYDPDSELFWITDFGDFQENDTKEWFEVIPGPHVTPGTHYLYINSTIEFSYKNPNLNKTRNLSKRIDLEVVKISDWYDPIIDNPRNVIIILAAIRTIATFSISNRPKIRNMWRRWMRSLKTIVNK